MSDVHIFEGKTTNEAIEKGLKELNIKKEQAEIKVLEDTEKRSFFSILAPRVVKVEIQIKENIKKEELKKEIVISEDDLEKAKKQVEIFLEEWLKTLPSENMEYELQTSENYIKVNLKGKDINYLIGYRGEVLNSIQTILSHIAIKNVESKIRVILDLDNYREKRKKTLEDLAEKLAKTVLREGKDIKLEPMSSYERKIIHSKLQQNPKIKTQSVGEEPYRRIIISKIK